MFICRTVSFFLALILGFRFCAAEEPSTEPKTEGIRFDFEDGTPQGWETLEGEFAQLITDRRFYHNFSDRPYNKQGTYYLSTVEQEPEKPSNDMMTGIVESPVFELTEPTITFLIGGAQRENSYGELAALLPNGEIERIERFRGIPNLEEFKRVDFSVPAEYLGRPLLFRLIDHETAGWGHVTLDDFSFAGRIDAEKTELRRQVFKRRQYREIIDRLAARIDETLRLLKSLEAESPELTAEAVSITAGRAALTTEFDKLFNLPLKEQNEAIERCVEVSNRLESRIDRLRQKIIERSPVLSESPILYVARYPYNSHYHAIDTLFNSDEFNPERNAPHKTLFSPGGALKLWFSASGRTATLVETPGGAVRDPDVDFDAGRIIFALRESPDDDYHLWTVTPNGGRSFADLEPDATAPALVRFNDKIAHHPDVTLRQLTRLRCAADFDPIWLPDGSVVFASTRDPKYNMCSRDIASDLYRMNGDGSNIFQLTRGTLFEHNPTLLPDGRILYHRWEYVDRNFGDAHGLWTVNPDGTNQSIYWGNNTAVPGAVYNPTFLEETGEVLCLFGPHHGRENGAIAILDRRLGIDAPDGVVRLCPESFRPWLRASGPFDCDTTMGAIPLKFEDPAPLDSSRFLASRMREPEGPCALYFVDRDGNQMELLSDERSIYDPIPVRPRERPELSAPKRDFGQHDGICYVMNVYEGTHMRNVPRGSVKYLRVIESPPKRNFSPGSWNGQGYTAPGMNWHSLENKRILGTVTVEEDGSAGFRVPCDTFVFFQLLDENGRMIQTMRSGTVLQSNETVSCVGCHENRLETSRNNPGTLPIASSKPPQTLRPWYGPPREFGFMTEVQPVLDRHCVACHDYGKPAGEKLNLAADRDFVFNAAYVSLWRSPFIRCIGAGPAELLDAGSWGASASPLIQELDNPKIPEHQEYNFAEKMTAEEKDRLAVWLDLNGVYYPYYESAYPESLTGRTPLSVEEMSRLAELSGQKMSDWRNFGSYSGPLVSWERPEASPLLNLVAERLRAEKPDEDPTARPEYREALALIRLGGERLAQKPRADMPGFIPCEKDRQRLEKAARFRDIEMINRAAIERGEKHFDEP